MRMHAMFQRVVTAGPTLWTTDVLPVDAAGNYLPPRTPGSTNSAPVDNVFTASPIDKQGNPSQQIAVAYAGPSGAGTVAVTLYVWDALTHQYYVVPSGSAVALTSGTIKLFAAIALGGNPPKVGNLLDALPGATDYVLVTNPSGLTTTGTYTFAMASIVGVT